jgi:hypothetical protein
MVGTISGQTSGSAPGRVPIICRTEARDSQVFGASLGLASTLFEVASLDNRENASCTVVMNCSSQLRGPQSWAVVGSSTTAQRVAIGSSGTKRTFNVRWAT